MKHIKGLDGLRGISIIFVVSSHIWFPELLSDASLFKKNYLLISGVTGVMIFFTLSGFLITLLMLEERAVKGKIELKKFFIRRFLRLLPPLGVFYLLLSVLMVTKQLPSNLVALFVSFFYLGNFIPKKFWVGELFHTWSLGVEEQFYLLWPFVVKKFSSWRKLFRIALAFVLISLLFIEILPILSLYYKGKERYLTNYFYTNCWFIPACLPIMLGALGGAMTFYKKELFCKHLRWRIFFLLISLLVYCCPLYTPKAIEQGLVLGLQSVGITLLLVWIWFNQGSIVVSILEFRPLRFLGLISYGVYVYQGLFLRTGPGGLLAIQQYPTNIYLTLCLSVVSYFTIERWSQKYKRRFR